MSDVRIIRRSLATARAANAADAKLTIPTSRMTILEVPSAFVLRFGSSDADAVPISRPIPYNRCDGKPIGDVFLENAAASGDAVFMLSDVIEGDVTGASADSGASSGGIPYISVDDDLGAINAETFFLVNSSLGRNATAGSVTAPATNTGKIEWSVSSNGASYSAWYPLQPGQSYDLDGIDVHTIKVRPSIANEDVQIEAH